MTDKLQLLINPTGWFSKKSCWEDALLGMKCFLCSIIVSFYDLCSPAKKNLSDQDTFYCFKIKPRGLKEVKSIRRCCKIHIQELKSWSFSHCETSDCADISPRLEFWDGGNKTNILSLCFFPPEIPPPAPLQTQDGSAVATVKWTLVGFCFWFFCCCFFVVFFYLLGPVEVNCAETFVIYAKTIQQTPDEKSTPASNIEMEGGGAKAAKIGKLQHRRCNTGAFLRNWNLFLFFVRYVLDMWTKREKKEEKAYIYTFVQKRHSEPYHDTTGALFTRYVWSHVFTSITRCPRWPSGHFFIYKKKVFFAHLHNTLHIRGAQKVYG